MIHHQKEKYQKMASGKNIDLTHNIPKRILPCIVVSQFAGTSLWFAANAIVPELQRFFSFGSDLAGMITSSVQFGFIVGTLCFAFFAISDMFSPRKLFFACAALGGLANATLLLTNGGLLWIMLSRFITGFFLAGIYPIGMKIASGWYKEKLGKAIGYLVGALVLGTAFPHLLNGLGRSLPWKFVIYATSTVAILGGLIMFWYVKDGPYLGSGSGWDTTAIKKVFRIKKFRLAAFGYFGHMWELYTLWTFVPLVLISYSSQAELTINTSYWSFIIIAAGSIGCAVGGIYSRKFGSERIAWFQLICSGLCCLLLPFLFIVPTGPFLIFMIFWGMVVVGDSPQFSAVVASSAPKNLVGTGLTIVNSIGFAITIPSIQLVSCLSEHFSARYILLILTAGPLFGILAMQKLIRKKINSI